MLPLLLRHADDELTAVESILKAPVVDTLYCTTQWCWGEVPPGSSCAQTPTHPAVHIQRHRCKEKWSECQAAHSWGAAAEALCALHSLTSGGHPCCACVLCWRVERGQACFFPGLPAEHVSAAQVKFYSLMYRQHMIANQIKYFHSLEEYHTKCESLTRGPLVAKFGSDRSKASCTVWWCKLTGPSPY